MASRVRPGFIEPMQLLKVETLPDDRTKWLYELKLDGYRAVAFKADGRVSLRSRNDNDFNAKYPAVVRGLLKMPADTVIDGELVALDEQGRPSFNALQNASSSTPVVYFVFDVMVLSGIDVTGEPLERRRRLLREKVLPKLTAPAVSTDELDARLPDLIAAVRSQAFEGLVAKRRDSRYESGRRSGSWRKMRINRGQEFVIGGYTVGTSTFDALIFGYYEGDGLVYVARTRNGFTPAVRAALWRRFRGLEIPRCPFVNLPEKRSGRWGQGLTKAKMADCRWLRPELVANVEFVEWTEDNHLRHSRFVALREDKNAADVRRE